MLFTLNEKLEEFSSQVSGMTVRGVGGNLTFPVELAKLVGRKDGHIAPGTTC